GLALLELLEADAHPQAAEPERDLDVRLPVPLVGDVEALDAGHRLRHRGGVVQHLPHSRARRVEAPVALDPHRLSTATPPGPSLRSSSQTRWYGLQLRVIVLPSASCSAEQTAWMPAPPPSPIPF